MTVQEQLEFNLIQYKVEEIQTALMNQNSKHQELELKHNKQISFIFRLIGFLLGCIILLIIKTN